MTSVGQGVHKPLLNRFQFGDFGPCHRLIQLPILSVVLLRRNPLSICEMHPSLIQQNRLKHLILSPKHYQLEHPVLPSPSPQILQKILCQQHEEPYHIVLALHNIHTAFLKGFQILAVYNILHGENVVEVDIVFPKHVWDDGQLQESVHPNGNPSELHQPNHFLRVVVDVHGRDVSAEGMDSEDYSPSVFLHNLIHLLHDILDVSPLQSILVELVCLTHFQSWRGIIHNLSWELVPSPLLLVSRDSIHRNSEDLFIEMGEWIGCIEFSIKISESGDQEIGQELLLLGPGIIPVREFALHYVMVNLNG